MATITTDTFLDGGVARTAGENWTVNGCTLTVRTDTRVHANAPAAMTGILGSITLSNTIGGQLYINGTNVRWMAFDTGAGTVPAIGTTITQGGVTGYLLGVWADYILPPTAVGAAMPATGFLKFREVSGGTYSVGALTGISANASSPDVTGWMEVLVQEGSNVSSNSYNSKLTINGSWFNLGTTSGIPGQTVQLPVNGGGINTCVHGVQIETSPGSNIYEWYDAVHPTYWLTTYFNTDSRNKRVENAGFGLIRIGATSGGTNVGFTPAAGCKIRTPNVFLRSAISTNRHLNIYPNTTVTSRPIVFMLGDFTMSNASFDWYISPTTCPKLMTISNTCLERSLAGTGTTAILDDVVCSQSTTQGTNAPFVFNDCNINFNKVLLCNTGSTVYSINRSTGVLTNCAGHRFITTGSQSNTIFANCFDMTISDFSSYTATIHITAGDNIQVNNTDFIMRLDQNTTATNSSVFFLSGSKMTINGVTFGQKGALQNCHPYTNISSLSTSVGPIYIRNIGSVEQPLSTGTNALTYPNSVISVVSNNTINNLKVQRVYVSNLRNTFIADGNGQYGDNNLFENIGSANVSLISGSMPKNTFMKGMVLSTTSVATSNGVHWRDYFSPTGNTGNLIFNAVNPTNKTAPYITLSIANTANSGFNPTQVIMTTSGDYLISETPYFVLGHSSFQNVAPTTSSTGSYLNQYQIDTGSGWNGSWKTLNAANLSAETISPSIGFKFKIRINVSATSTTNQFTSVSIVTNSVSADRLNLYPLDTAQLGFTNLVTGSEVRVFTGTNPSTSVEIGGLESTAGSTFSFSHSSGGVEGVIAIFALGYQPIYLPYTFKSTDDSILIQQTVDRNYVNP